MTSAVRSFFLIVAASIVAAVLFSTSAGAQAAVPQCNGVDATITFGPNDVVGTSIEGTDGADVMVITDPTIAEGRQSVIVSGLDGDDLTCVSGVDVVLAGDGDDTVYVLGAPNSGRMVVEGGAGDDTIHGGDNPVSPAPGWYLEFIVGGSGDDTIYGNAGVDNLWGTDGNDTIHGNAGIDLIWGGGGEDTIYGGWGDDGIYGGDPSETDPNGEGIWSDTWDSADRIFGGPGDDIVGGQLGADEIFGGPGNDTLLSNVAVPLNSVTATTPTAARDDKGARMFGGTGNDLLVGSNRWDRMQGGPGDDLLAGLEGRDYMRGGPGADRLVGGGGIDDMNGNTGADQLVYDGAELVNGGWGIDRCEVASWPNHQGPATSCERAACRTSTSHAFQARMTKNWQLTGVVVQGFDLRAGDCVLKPLNTEPDALVTEVDCDIPHTYEVYREALIDSSITEYDVDAITTYANDVCRLSLDAYAGTERRDQVDFVVLTPSFESWNNEVDPDRIVTCALFAADGSLLTGRFN